MCGFLLRTGPSRRTRNLIRRSHAHFCVGQCASNRLMLLIRIGLASVWAHDKLLDDESNGKGANCWCCERTWGEVAHETVHRDREIFQADLAKDKQMLEKFLKQRDDVIRRARLTLAVR